MPLPPAPTKPADRLPPKAFVAVARSAARPAQKSENFESVKAPSARPAAERVVVKEAPKRAPAALLDKSTREQPPMVEPVTAPVMVQVETRPSTARS